MEELYFTAHEELIERYMKEHPTTTPESPGHRRGSLAMVRR